MSKKGEGMLFGTDGVRGKANFEPMSVETTMALAKAIGCFLREKKEKNRVVIGKDTRLSGYMFENALVAGLCSMGVDTLMVGPLPTPGVAFITRAYRADAGIVISASHNPFSDNGIKIFSKEGFKLLDSEEKKLEKMVEKGDFSKYMPQADALGRNRRIEDAGGRYIEFVKTTFVKGKTLKGLKIFLDCANGAGHRVGPLVFWELNAEMIVAGTGPDGLNINDQVGSLYPEVIQRGVKHHKADVGIAFDGDGDRVIMSDEKGHVVDGDTILAICAQHLKEREELKNDRIVVTVMTNYGVTQFLKGLGIEVFESKVGDRYVLQKMQEVKAFVGGEQSGHLLFLDYNTTGDGIVSALQVLKIMIETGQSLSKLAAGIKKLPQVLVNVAVKTKPPLDEIHKIKEEIEAAEKMLSDKGRVLVRYSGTENLCRVMVESPVKKQTEEIANKIAHVIKQELG